MNPRLIIVVLALALAASAAAAEERDRIFGPPPEKTDAFVESEGSEEVLFKTMPGSAVQRKKTRAVRRIVYAGMNVDGVWRRGMESKARGRYEEAAEFFGQLADAGTKEWEKIYGALQEGECWELARKFDFAAKAYDKVVKTADFTKDDKAQRRHRLWLDAAYHLGVAYALDSKPDDAAKVVDGLGVYAKLPNVANGPAAESRANGVRAAVAGVAGDLGNLRGYMQKANFRPIDELDAWFHFNLMAAEFYRAANKPKEALGIVNPMVDDPVLVSEPARKAQVELVKGLCLISTDPQGAVVELLKIDLLPYGSEDQKCLARYEAGRLLLAEVAKVKASKGDPARAQQRADFAKELTRTARLLLTAAVDSTSSVQAKADAKGVLDKMEPEDPPPATPGAAAPAADAEAGTTPAPAASDP